MAENDDLRLAELLCARLCHDLSGPIGGATAGVELLADADASDADDVRLLADSVNAAAAHLKFMRAAFGHGTTQFAPGELEGLSRALLAGRGNLALDWRDEGGEAPRSLGKLALALILVARDALARGGTVAVALRPSVGRAEITAAGASPGGAELMAGFDVSASELGPRAAPARYALRHAAASGALLEMEQDDALLRFTVRPGGR